MGSDIIQDGSVSIENLSSGEMEAESNNIDSLEAVSSSGYSRELESAAKILTRVELDLACSSEKLVNLDILVMHVASRENDFEAFALEEEPTLKGCVEKALEFDLLYGILDSEIRELESHLSALQSEITNSKEIMSSFKHLGESLKEIEEKLQDCEESLERSFEQVVDIKGQSGNFLRILLSSSGDEKWKGDKDLIGLENCGISDSNVKIKMETAEQQRYVLRMLEKSLAREMDLEKKLSESRQTEEDLNIKLQQEILYIEEEAEYVWKRLFEAENKAEILLGGLKECFGRIQTEQFNAHESIKREGEMKSKLQDLIKQLKEKDVALLESERYKAELEAKVDLLENTHRELDRVEQLERQLNDSEVKCLHAEASAEASQEKQIMLDCTIKDMESLIQDLKVKVLKAESRTERAEEKCIILSESNAELIEEINFQKAKIISLETSLHQTAEAKKKTVKQIKMQTQLIADLIMQLALERERLHKQISSLTEEKKTTVKYSQHVRMEPSIAVIGSHDAKTGNEPTDSLTSEIKTDDADSTSNTNANTARNIDARQLTLKYVLMAVLVLVIPALAVLLFQQ